MYRASSGSLNQQAVQQTLNTLLRESESVPVKLRALWTLHSLNLTGERQLINLLNHESEYIRAWAIQFLAENRNPSEAALVAWAQLAESDPSPHVRLYLASAMQRTPLSQRKEVLLKLISHPEDAEDHNLPLMYWYALEPVVGQDRSFALQAMSSTKIPKLRQFTTRRITTSSRQ
jgi:hypothetical protein